MTFANNNRDQAPRDVVPDLLSILFDTHHHSKLKTGCLDFSEATEKNNNLQLSENVWRTLYVRQYALEPKYSKICLHNDPKKNNIKTLTSW